MIALDTSVAVPLLVQTHRAHDSVVRWWAGRELALCGHAVPETYSVLTRLPGDLRVTPVDAVRLLRARFAARLHLKPRTTARLPEILAELGVAGGAVYDALVALAALEHELVLASRDGRATPTYQAIGVRVVIAGD